MRQPHAQLTGKESLDQCYVYCNNADVGTVVTQVKNGLESEGLTGLGNEVMDASDTRQGSELQEIQHQTVQRREQFQGQEIYLPVVRHRDGDKWIQLNYQAHILPHIDWSAIEPPDPQASAPQSIRRQSATVDVGESAPVFHPDQGSPYIDKTVSVSDLARRLSDIMPNLWQAARIAEQMTENLKQNGETEAEIYDRRSYLAHVLREHVKSEVEKQAEQVFRRKLDQDEIRFDLETREPNYRMVDSYKIQVHSNDRQLERYGEPVQLTLFEKVFEQQFDSELEKNFAYYLDEERALQWWHRVAARQRGEYYLQGWKQGRIYPDFVAMTNEIVGVTHVLIFDTKGEHLAGNLDTEYKRKVLETLEGAFNTAGRMVVRDGPKREGIFQLVFSEQQFLEISARLNDE